MSFRIEARFGLGIENVHKTADLSKSLWYSKTQLGEHLLYDFLCGFFILYIKKLDDLRNRVNDNKLEIELEAYSELQQGKVWYITWPDYNLIWQCNRSTQNWQDASWKPGMRTMVATHPPCSGH